MFAANPQRSADDRSHYCSSDTFGMDVVGFIWLQKLDGTNFIANDGGQLFVLPFVSCPRTVML